MPLVIRAMRLPDEGDDDQEEITARYLGALAAVERLDRLAASPAAATLQAPAIARLRAEYDERIAYYRRRLAAPPTGGGAPTADSGDGSEPGATDACAVNVNYRLEGLAAERQMVLRLRDQGVIGDSVLRSVQEDLDLEASRLTD